MAASKTEVNFKPSFLIRSARASEANLQTHCPGKALAQDVQLCESARFTNWQAGYSSVGRACDCSFLRQSDGPSIRRDSVTVTAMWATGQATVQTRSHFTCVSVWRCRTTGGRQSQASSGVAQWLACWAHNPNVRGSKPHSATFVSACQSICFCARKTS